MTKTLSWGPHNSNFTMVYGTQITILTGVYKPTNITGGAPHCREKGSDMKRFPSQILQRFHGTSIKWGSQNLEPRNDAVYHDPCQSFWALPRYSQHQLWLGKTNQHFARNGYGSIPIHTIFRGMNIHLPAILMFTRDRVLTHPQMMGKLRKSVFLTILVTPGRKLWGVHLKYSPPGHPKCHTLEAALFRTWLIQRENKGDMFDSKILAFE